MENLLVRWTADLVGYPATAAGHIASGGSLANLTAIVTAREAHGLKAADFPQVAVYLTSQAHHCIEKALRLTGLGEAQIRHIPADDRYRMRPDALEAAIARDREAGLTPWLVVATAGTTDLGVVDPLEPIGGVAKDAGCWFHVDAAYGGFFLLTGTGRALLAGIERSDSVVLDPHKSLFLPWGAGIMIARNVRQLVDAHAGSGHYMQDARAATSELSPADISPELTKPFRALAMWLPLVTLGTRPFAAALDEKLLLARYFYDEVRKLGFVADPPPDLSVVGFRWAPENATPEEADEMNRTIVDALRTDGRVFLSSTELNGRFTIRMAALAHRTHRREIDLTLELLKEQVERLG
ncbi:MAG: pyridoxal phosphate-dependent decarboxylase family protein [Gemmatimonadota bacterium]